MCTIHVRMEWRYAKKKKLIFCVHKNRALIFYLATRLESSLLGAYVDAIKNAQYFVYIENQVKKKKKFSKMRKKKTGAANLDYIIVLSIISCRRGR